jgi:hypothetical protein
MKPKREREREGESFRKDSRRVESKRKIMWEKWETVYFRKEGKIILLLEGSQAMPTRPFDKGRMRVKTLG